MYFSSLWLKREKEGNADPESRRPGQSSAVGRLFPLLIPDLEENADAAGDEGEQDASEDRFAGDLQGFRECKTDEKEDPETGTSGQEKSGDNGHPYGCFAPDRSNVLRHDGFGEISEVGAIVAVGPGLSATGPARPAKH